MKILFTDLVKHFLSCFPKDKYILRSRRKSGTKDTLNIIISTETLTLLTEIGELFGTTPDKIGGVILNVVAESIYNECKEGIGEKILRFVQGKKRVSKKKNN